MQRLLKPLAMRLRGIVARAVIKAVADEGALQTLQVRVNADELLDGVEHFQPYGHAARPLPGAEGIALAVGGHRSHTVVICVGDRRYRLKGLKAGEVGLYDDLGNRVLLGREAMQLKAVQKLVIEAPETDIESIVKLTGQFWVNNKRVDDTHTHDDVTPGTGKSGGVT